jgi:hypothetical protein
LIRRAAYRYRGWAFGTDGCLELSESARVERIPISLRECDRVPVKGATRLHRGTAGEASLPKRIHGSASPNGAAARSYPAIPNYRLVQSER